MIDCKQEMELHSEDGSLVRICPSPEGEALETRDSLGRLLFEYHPATGRGILHFSGTGLDIQSAGRVRIHSDTTIDLEAKHGVRLAGPDAHLELNRGIEITSPAVHAEIEDLRYSGHSLVAQASEARTSFGKLEQVVGRFFQFARHWYQRAEALLHTRAGRIRAEASESYLLQTEQVSVQATQDVRIQGKTINLG